MFAYRKHKDRKGVRVPLNSTHVNRPRAKDVGYHSYLTAMCPIEPVEKNDATVLIEQQLRSFDQENSPFKKCPMVHMLRLQIVDRMHPALGDRNAKGLKSKYLLLITDVDGDVADFLDCLYREEPEFVHAVWGQCMSYPDEKGAVFFRRYIERCSLPAQLPIAAFPNSALDILRALDTQRALTYWMSQHHRPDADLQRQWQAFSRVLQARGDMQSGELMSETKNISGISVEMDGDISTSLRPDQDQMEQAS